MLSESQMILARARRAVKLRRKLEAQEMARKSYLHDMMAALKKEGQMIDAALRHLNLDHFQKQDFVAKNSEYVSSPDGSELIQVVLMSNRQLFIHRLISSDLRKEFKEHHLGTWSESNPPWMKEKVLAKVAKLLSDRADQRLRCPRLDFGSGVGSQAIKHEHPQG